MSTPWREEVDATVRLAIPVIIGQVGMMAMGVVDVAIVGHHSREALAAIGLGNTYAFGVIVFCIGVLQALDPLISQAVGARDDEAIGSNVQRGFVIALGLALPAWLLLLPAESVLRALGQPDDVIPEAGKVIVALAPGVLPFLWFVMLRQTLQALSITSAIVITVVVANAVNLVLDLVLVGGAFGFPAFGAVGCAWGTTLCRLLLAGVLAALAWKELREHVLPLRRSAIAWRPLLGMLRIGIPIGCAHLVEHGAFLTTALLMGRFTAVELSGHQVAIVIAAFSFMVPLGIGSAASVRVGYAVGRGDRDGAARAAAASLVGGVLVMSCFMVLFLSAPTGIAALFTSDEAVVAMAALLLPLAGIFQVFDGVQVVAAGVLRGLSDTRTPVVVHLLGFWVLGIPIGIWLTWPQDVGPPGLWWGLVIGLGVAAIVLLWAVRLRLRGAPVRARVD